MARRRKSPVHVEIAEPHICTIDLRLKILKQVPFFADLPQQEMQDFNSRFTESGYQAGEIICLSGDEALRLYVVASGKVKLLQHTVEGQEVMLDILMAGEHFGSLLALGDDVYPNTAQAHTGVCVLNINAEDFRSILATCPPVALKVLDIISQRLRDTQVMVRQLSAASVEQRIAFTLLKLAQKLGDDHEEGILIQMPLSREDLAAMTGTTLETASRTLSRLQKAGAINTGRQWVAIADRDQLEILADTLDI